MGWGLLVCVATTATHADGTGWHGFLGCTGWGASEGRGSTSLTALHPPSVLDAAGLARSLFNQLWEVCSQQQVQEHEPVEAQVLQRPWLVSVHAVRNARRRREDRHVCLPAFNQLFGLSVSIQPVEKVSASVRTAWEPAEGPWAPSGRDIHSCHWEPICPAPLDLGRPRPHWEPPDACYLFPHSWQLGPE